MGDLALAQALHSLCQKVKHPHSRKSESTMIRKTANSHNWTQIHCQEIKGKGWGGAAELDHRESSQTRGAADLKASSMALSCSEAKTYQACLTHSQPQPPLPRPRRVAGWAHAEGHPQLYSSALQVPKSSESLSLSSSWHGHNLYQLCRRRWHQQLLRVPVKEPRGGDEVTW